MDPVIHVMNKFETPLHVPTLNYVFEACTKKLESNPEAKKKKLNCFFYNVEQSNIFLIEKKIMFIRLSNKGFIFSFILCDYLVLQA